MILDTHSGTGLYDHNEGMEVDNDTTNGDFLVDEDGFVDLTAEYYLVYDLWYAEDSRAEFDEMTAYLHTNNQSGLSPNVGTNPGYSCATGGRYNWGVDGGDCIRSAVTANPLSAYGKRDNMFVRVYQYDKDRNINCPRKEPDMYLATGYGRLDFILALTLPPNPRFGIEEPQLHILAHITEAKDAEGNARMERVSYTQLGRSFVLDITTIQRVVGGVETRGEKATGEWVIIGHNDELCPATFHPEEAAHED
ncbi:hypothetical protein FRC12_002358 [Ceratobasidium sp. 428]|nr:hypothetical protein FRC12_002358 [Ceratobasidium sp. 428]